ncbi:hypothetical protein D3C75_685750 [compost metagenome]
MISVMIPRSPATNRVLSKIKLVATSGTNPFDVYFVVTYMLFIIVKCFVMGNVGEGSEGVTVLICWISSSAFSSFFSRVSALVSIMAVT